MNKTNVKVTVREMITANSCCEELRAAGQAYLDANGAEQARKNLIAVLKDDVCTIDDFLNLTASDAGKNLFGAKNAEKMHESGVAAKAKGERFCLCPACQAGGKLLDNEGDL